MKIAIIASSVVLLAAGATEIAVQRRQQARLRLEITQLTRHCAQIVQLRAEHQRLVATSAPESEVHDLRTTPRELERQRSLLASLNWQVKVRAEIRATASPPKPLDPGMTPLASIAGAGTDTPASAEQTFFWTLAQIDTDAMARQLVLTPEARSKAEKLMASLDNDSRAKMDTPEKLMAFYLVGLLGRVSGVQMLDQEAVGPDEATWKAKLQLVSGRKKDFDVTVRRGPDGWREEVPAAMVDRWAAYLQPKVPKN